jgi:hypothetical protein
VTAASIPLRHPGDASGAQRVRSGAADAPLVAAAGAAALTRFGGSRRLLPVTVSLQCVRLARRTAAAARVSALD